MTRKELAELIGVSRNTLNTWEKEKPELIKIINMGLHAEEIIKETNYLNKKLKEIRKKTNSGKLVLPKNKIDEEELIDYWNPKDFDEDRVEEICKFLASKTTEELKEPILEAMIDMDIRGGTYERIKKQKTKRIIFEEFGKFLRELKHEIKENITNGIGKYIVMEFNKRNHFDFSEKDVEIHDHIVTLYDMYNVKYKIEK